MNRKEFSVSASLLGLSSLVYGRNTFSVQSKGKRVGIVGLDSSHAIAFTKELNTNQATENYNGYHVVAAYPFGSPNIPLNAKRIPLFTEQIKEFGVKIVDTLTELLKQVDVILLETNDGNLHLQQAEQLLKARKPIFIDKPIANSYEDATKIFALAEKHKTPIFSTSALRYIQGLADIDKTSILGADVYSPAYLEPSHKDLYWYGIHGVEMLIALLGEGLKSVTTTDTENAAIYIGKWSDGRIGTLRGTRNDVDGFGGTVFTKNNTVKLGEYQGYVPLLKQIVSFFDTGKVPVTKQETLAVCSFIDAAYQSKQQNGAEIQLK